MQCVARALMYHRMPCDEELIKMILSIKMYKPAGAELLEIL